MLDGPELELVPRYNIAPSQNSIVIVSEEGRPVAKVMKWGFAPPWAAHGRAAGGGRASGAQKPLINARAETVAEKRSFKSAFENRRCLIPADGFYEWMKAPTGKGKTPFRFLLRSEQIFSMAGIWSRSVSDSGGEINSFTIITTSANELMAPVHDRMPVILNPADESLWIADNCENAKETFSELMVPYSSENMKCYEVSPRVSSAASEGPDCIVPYKEMDLFSGFDD